MTLKDAYLNLLIQSHPATTILTPNRRLAATLHKLYQQHQLAQHQRAFLTPDILPLSSWLQRAWQDHLHLFPSSPLLLSTIQEQFLWEKILSHAKEGEYLLQVSETADMAKSAWGLLQQWRVSLTLPEFTEAHEYSIFKKWMETFRALILDQSLLDSASLPDYLGELMCEKKMMTGHHFILIGFNEISPQLNHLLACCRKADNTVFIMQTPKQASHCRRVNFADEEQEIISMARFSKAIYSQDNESTIGCVFPFLDKKRDHILHLFSQVFAEDRILMNEGHTLPFNISAGKPLLNCPIIHAAMQLLSLYQKTVPIDTMSYLLTSPFLGEAESERMKRAQYDFLLRKENLHQINLGHITQENSRVSLQQHCPHFARRLHAFLSLLTDKSISSSHHTWSRQFNALLTLWGWPGERSLNSHEYQMVEQFLNLLRDLASLDQVSPPVSYTQALKTLRKMTAKHIFQPKTPDAPIQLLGMLEAAGLPFDYLWLSGMTDLSWPSKPSPHPLVPKSLQRKLQMPHASAEREFLYCETLTTQFKHSAPTVIFSHAEKNEDTECQMSPLLRDIPFLPSGKLTLSPYQAAQEIIYHSKQIDVLLDDAAPPVLPHEKIQGGSSILKQQALCPFKSFAEARLHAQTMEIPSPGLRAKDRGVLLHKALEYLWNHLKDHHTLVSLSTEQLHHAITSSIESAFQLVPHSRHQLKAYLALEKRRLHALLLQWLEHEKNRAPFKVLMSEKTEKIQLHDLNLSLRIDRIDELSDGKKLIIDYKMGKNQDIADWLSERPIEPQLPLYALLDKDNTVGITFAQLYAGEIGFKGMSQYSLDIKGIKPVTEIKKSGAANWTEQIAQWQTALQNLSHDFCEGKAPVDPKAADTCRWCELRPLCRIDEERHNEQTH